MDSKQNRESNSIASNNGHDNNQNEIINDQQDKEKIIIGGYSQVNEYQSNETDTLERDENLSSNQKNIPFWQRFNLKTKATLLAIALGTVPVLAIGGINYYLTEQSLTKQELKYQKTRAVTVSNDLTQFAKTNYQQVIDLSNLPLLTNPELSQALTKQEKEKALESFLKNGINSIVVIDAKTGNTLLEGREKDREETIPNYSKIDYWQEVVKTKEPVINPLRISKANNLSSFFVAAPVFHERTGELLYVIRTRTDASYIDNLIRSSIKSRSQEVGDKDDPKYLVADNNNKVFVSENSKEIDQEINKFFPEFSTLKTDQKTQVTFDVSTIDKEKYVVAYSPLQNIDGLPTQDWSIIVADKVSTAFAPQRYLLLTFTAGTLLTALGVAILAAYLANRFTQPIINAAQAVEQIGDGELDTRIEVKGNDELAKLGSNINRMVQQIQTLLVEQEEATRQRLEAQQDSQQQQLIAEQERQQQQQLQNELIRLLSDIEEATNGNLTVRAEISDGQIGIVADFFNAIIENLRDIVTQVKQTTQQVNSSLSGDEKSIQELAQQSQGQAQQIQQVLNSVEAMAQSIQQVSANAQEAAQAARESSQTAELSGDAMDNTVNSILQLRDTVGETTKKVKRLGESSQQISKVISLINQIALQTNLLAINASIEAARAGEEGRGFAVVAEEVGQLAAQSAAATKEIEKIVETIQRETTAVVEAMEVGTAQVVEGTNLAESTKKSLGKIVTVSRHIDELLQSISQTTVSQADTSQSVTQLMEEVAQVSQKTSCSSIEVSQSLQKTAKMANQLQDSVDTFKLS
ncbi:methyl-accepting chemotaxis protein [Crocosphaera chwakensis]|uniref:Methyl-accepting chemotaxis protein n=1 Tax=Crocosphaera chwakensis CCY0110 TaxID=391612 RepID=A3IM08_9CHRO|nr:methyl-accepting chemotaxis protein [Crocosphaera chwakensis]EAZ92464.1 methyl-accepting chemotaxis protein [Crocosphaera chwakensis CCY0110]